MGRVLCIANQKGGVGKTTTAVNLAATLAAAQKRTLLIDMDPQGSATSGLGARDLGERPTTYDIVMGERPIREVALPTRSRRSSSCRHTGIWSEPRSNWCPLWRASSGYAKR